ncbi:MAG: transposase, partial [Candidatus Omnitrophica bacterium]|nr:transposase [Candidatus Omnitrophota bacterium]
MNLFKFDIGFLQCVDISAVLLNAIFDDVTTLVYRFKMADYNNSTGKRTYLQYLYENVSKDVGFLRASTSLSRATVYRTISKISAGESIEHGTGAGRPQIYNPNDRRRLAQLALRNRTESARKLGMLMQLKGSPAASDRTVRRHLNNMQYWSLLPKPVPMLSAENMETRVKWAQDFQDFRWDDVIFSDESAVQLFRNKLTVWTDIKKESRVKKPMPIKSPSLMIWGAISMKGQSELRIIDTTIDQYVYQQVLGDTLLPFVEDNFPDHYVFQHDNAPPHKAKSTVAWMNDVISHVLPWPSKSPDLNPIKNVWKVLKDKVDRRRCLT